MNKGCVIKSVTQILFRVLHGEANSKCKRNVWPNGRCTVVAREYQMAIWITWAVKNVQLLRSTVGFQLVGKV